MREAGRQVLSYLPEGLRALIQQLVMDVEWLKKRIDQRPSGDEEVIWFHWPGPVADFVGESVGPNWFTSPGLIYRLEYRFDVAGSVTVAWDHDGEALGGPDTVTVDSTQGVSESTSGASITGSVTAADATASGLTVFIYKR